MSSYSEGMLNEREKFGEEFIQWATTVCTEIRTQGFWADLIDPNSGIPYLGLAGNTVYMETDDAVNALGYQVLDFGCCKAVCHNKWSTFAFLSTFCSSAPVDVIQTAIH